MFTLKGVERRKHSVPLGFVNEITMREAKARKQQIMATINAGQIRLPIADSVSRTRGAFLGPACADAWIGHAREPPDADQEPYFARLW